MTRVIHTGDTHIGYQQYNAPERRRDFLRAFRQVAEDAVDDDVDAVVHAGDLFHDRRPSLVDLQGTVEVLRTLSDAGIPFLAVVGNHESKRDAQWLDLFEDLGLATRLGSEPHVIDDVAFYGLDFVPRSRRDDLEYAFETLPDEADHAALVSHGLFEPFAHADWETETVLEEATVEFDAMLLGDNHAPDTADVLDTWVTYCGSTERASADEREDRGYNLVTFDANEPDSDGDRVAIARRGLDATRDFVFVDVELAAGEGLDRVRDRVREYDLDESVVIVTVEGEGTPFAPAAIEEFAIERGALVARVNDRRDVDQNEEVTVSFADPDDAVRERVRELGLSDAARDIDRTVRDVDDIADSNVRETVERRVREVLDGDRSAFEPARADANDAGERAAGEREETPVDGATDGADTDADDSPGADVDETGVDDETTVTVEAETTGGAKPPEDAETTDGGGTTIDAEALDETASAIDEDGERKTTDGDETAESDETTDGNGATSDDETVPVNEDDADPSTDEDGTAGDDEQVSMGDFA